MKKYSIVIPCYNSRETIVRCINSCINQTYKNFEIIIIDDGSTDGTYELCGKCFKDEDTVRFYKKENGGVSSARNLGLRKAVGDRIVFLDSDDELILDALEIYNKYEYDLVVGGLVEQNRECILNKTPRYLEIHNSKEILKYGFKKEYLSFLTIPVAKFFELNIIKKNHIIFDESLDYGEDTAFVIEYLACSNNIVFINCNTYLNYTENLQSLSRRKINDIWEILQKILNKFQKSFNKLQNSDEYKNAYDCLYIRNIKVSLMNYMKFNDYKIFCDGFEQIWKDLKTNRIDNKSYGLKDKLLLFFIKTKNKTLIFIMLKILIRKQ